MGKYTNLDSDVYSVFGTVGWKAEKIKTHPSNFIAIDTSTEFIRVSIIPSGNGVNRRSISGVLIIDIFTPSGSGPQRPSAIADKLDTYLSSKQLIVSSGIVIQFGNSTLGNTGNDKDNKALFRVAYTIPFNYFEVL